MRSTKPKHLSALFAALIIFLGGSSFAQKPTSTPRQEKLLNGLKVLVWNDPAAEKVSVKLRIHAGAAFDPQGKEGVMKLLSESFFPTAESKSYFREELDGSLEVISNHDYIQVNAEARNAEMITLLETIAQAVTNPDIDKDATAALKVSLGPQLAAAEKDPAYMANLAAAKRLFGSFPYGRPVIGSPASLEKIDFADLKLAKDRLLTADNATLAIRGNLDPSLTLRAARRYFGAWLKSDKPAPPTFRQPDAPDAAVAKAEAAGLAYSEVRFMTRGLARSSREYPAAEVLARVLQTRFAEAVAKVSGTDAAVAHNEHILPGAFVFSYRTQPNAARIFGDDADKGASRLSSLFATPITETEFAAAKAGVAAAAERLDPIDLWLDVDTFKIASPSAEVRAFQTVSLNDVNSLAARYVREPVATIVLTPPAVNQ